MENLDETLDISEVSQTNIQKQIQQTHEKNSSLVKEVHEKLQEKQYQATLGIGNIFYAIVGFIFQYQTDSFSKINFPNFLFYSIIIYYSIYSYRVIKQYVIIMQVYEEISKENVLSFSIDLEINSDEDRKKNFQRTLLDRIKFDNNFCGIFGFLIFTLHLTYMIFFNEEEPQSILFLAIIFTGYYINMFIYIFFSISSIIKKAFKKVKQNEKKDVLSETALSHDSCCICMDQFQKGQYLQQYSCCNNVFHMECISEWKEVSNTCPLCRQNI